MKQMLRWVIVAGWVAAGVLITGCSGVNALFNPASAEPTPLPVVKSEALVSAEGRVVPSRYVTLAFPLSGKLGEISAVEGASVEKGTRLASLDENERLTAALRSAEFEQETARQALDALNKDTDLAASQAGLAAAQAKTSLMEAQKVYDDTQTRDFRDRLDEKETAVQDRKETLDDRKTTLDRYSNLDLNNPTRVSAQDNYDVALEDYNTAVYERDQLANLSRSARKSLDQADQTLRKAQRELDKLSSGPNPDLLAQAQKRLDAAQAQVSAAQRGLDDLQLLAPFTGLIADVRPLEPGGLISAGQAVVTLADNSEWYVETTDLTELDVVLIQKGDKVTIKVDALPDASIKGEVVNIAQTYTEKSGDILYQVRIRFDNPPEGLRWGMTANVSFGSR